MSPSLLRQFQKFDLMHDVKVHAPEHESMGDAMAGSINNMARNRAIDPEISSSITHRNQ